MNRYRKNKSGLWLKDKLADQAGFLPGLLPAYSQGGPEIPLTGLAVWLKTPIAGVSDLDQISADTINWLDSSGNGLDGVGPGGANPKPVYHTNVVDGLPAVDFFTNGGAGCSIDGFNAFATGWSGATIFYVLKANDDTPAVNSGQGVFGYSTEIYPSTASHIFDDAFSTAQKDLGDPAGDLSLWHLYFATSATNDWKGYLNGTEIFSTATNTFVNNLDPFFEPSIGKNNVNQKFDGYIAEFGIYDHVLDSTERAALVAYIAGRFPTIGI